MGTAGTISLREFALHVAVRTQTSMWAAFDSAKVWKYSIEKCGILYIELKRVILLNFTSVYSLFTTM